ncbi:MAG TPA: FUSC family protein, partial [Xanthobacteraceae bacterium]|nr:FUSC family protein [Xanthobacteraceae bacterium]
MTDRVAEPGSIRSRATPSPLGAALPHALSVASPPLLFGVRLWASVCFALFVAFSLQIDNPFWAATSAAIVCQPQLGASLRKGWFRMIGTVVGATTVVVLTAWFPQDRIAFLALLALWGGLCAFVATVLRNFASYAAALAGYTAAIIAADNLGATGGASPDVFLLAVYRASAICIGIVCAGIVLAGTDLGGARQRLAASFASLTAEIAGRFNRMLALAGPQLPDTQPERREFARRVIALDPMIDQALGESGHVRYHAPTLEAAVHGLFRALDGWRGVATHLSRSRDDRDRQGAEAVLRAIPMELRAAQESGLPPRWMADPTALRRSCEEAVRRLLALPADTPSLRLIADETAKVLAGLVRALDGVALLGDAPHRPAPGRGGLRLFVPDWLPALVNAARAFVAIGAVELFWVATAWPDGATALVFVAAVGLLLSPSGDLAYAGALAFTLGTAGAVVFAAIVKFAVLPALETFPAFCVVYALYFIPLGFVVARSRHPAVVVALTAMAITFGPLLAPTNPMSYATQQFYNAALAVFAGCAVAALSFRLLPPVPPALRARRLLASTGRDLRRVAIDPLPPRLEYWEGRMYARLAALPDQAEPLQRARLLAALTVGTEIIYLRAAAPGPANAAQIDRALKALAHGSSATTTM